MSLLIYSDTSRLKILREKGSFRLDCNRSEIAKLKHFKNRDKIFFYNKDTGEIYGYGILKKQKEIPTKGFFIKKKNFKDFISSYLLLIETRTLYERGFKVKRSSCSGYSTSIEWIPEEKSKWFLEKLTYNNRKLTKILIAFTKEINNSSSYSNFDVYSVLIYILENGSLIISKKLRISKSFENDLIDRIKMVENLQQKKGDTSLYDCLMDIGIGIYNQIFRPLGLDFLWTEGDYSIDFFFDSRDFFFPLEIAIHEGLFLFKKNIISVLGSTSDSIAFNYLREKGYKEKGVIRVEKVLLLPSLSNHLENPLGEVSELFKVFRNWMDQRAFEIHLIARDISFELLKKNIQSSDIIHICGHTGKDRENGIIINTLLTVLEELPEGQKPGMIFINSCGWGYNTGLQITACGVECCITARNRIPDSSSHPFVNSLYSFIKHGFPVSYSFNRALNKDHDEDRLLPLSFSFFGNNRIRYEL